MKILVVAPPRSGTGYASKCLRSIGIDVGHERMGVNGISSWSWAVDCYQDTRWGDNFQDIKPDITVMLYRRPEDVIASLAFTAERALTWMNGYVPITKHQVLEKSAQAVSGWISKCLERKPDRIVHLSDFPFFCKRMFGKYPDEELRGYNKRTHRSLTEEELESIDSYSHEIRRLIKNHEFENFTG